MKTTAMQTVLLLAVALALGANARADELDNDVNDAPLPQEPLPAEDVVDIDLPPRARRALSLDPTNRASVASAFNKHMSSQPPSEYSGDPITCKVGGVSSAYVQHATERLNIYRALTGLPGVSHNSADAAKCQEAATIFAHKVLTHYLDPSAPCYTDNAAFAAARSNIGWGRTGSNSIDQYIDDAGKNNDVVGHRRWFLWPRLGKVGFGFVDVKYGYNGLVPSSCAMVLNGGTVSRPSSPKSTAWPPRNAFVPTALMPRKSRRWSYSRPNADFSSVAITVTRNGKQLPVTLEPRIVNGYADNTVVFIVDDAAAYDLLRETDAVYEVVVSNIGSSDISRDAYTVTAFNPSVGEPATTTTTTKATTTTTKAATTTTKATTTTTKAATTTTKPAVGEECPPEVSYGDCKSMCKTLGLRKDWTNTRSDGCRKICTCDCKKPKTERKCKRRCKRRGFNYNHLEQLGECEGVCQCTCKRPKTERKCKRKCARMGHNYKHYAHKDGCDGVCVCTCREPVKWWQCRNKCQANGKDYKFYNRRLGCDGVCRCIKPSS